MAMRGMMMTREWIGWMRRRPARGLRGAAIGFAVGAAALALLAPVMGHAGAAAGTFWTEADGRGEEVEVTRVNRALVRLAQALNPAVVQIGIAGPAREEGEAPAERSRVGSGFVIDRSGYIVTNHHVIENASIVEVIFADGKKLQAKVVGKDARTDIALLKVEPAGELPALPLGDSDALEVGELVLAIGNPFGLSHTVTMGIVSRKGPGLRATGPFDDYIQTDAAINPGNSGGPLVNSRGAVVGIVTAVIPNRQVGFAIPINLAKTLLPELRDTGKVAWGFLGVGIQPVTEELAKGLDLKEPKGVLVNNALPGLPAEAAGVKRGDVIVGFDGKEIPDLRTLQRLVSRTAVGRQVEVRVVRGGALVTLTATVAEASAARRGGAPAGIPARDLGMQVQELDAELAKKFKLSKDEEGLVVSEVAKGGPAAAAGVQAGDVVREVNRKEVASLDAFRRALRGENPGVPDVFLIKRGEGFVYLAVRPKT
jgi:serine protease Do